MELMVQLEKDTEKKILGTGQKQTQWMVAPVSKNNNSLTPRVDT